MRYLPPVITVMVQAAEKVGRFLVREFGEVENLQVSRKGPADFVSAADRKASSLLIAALQKAHPEWDILCEEAGLIEGKGNGVTRFVIDPLDGTTNFLHGLPHFAVSVGLESAGHSQAGVVYDPLLDELFWAKEGEGAYLNNQRLRVSGRSSLVDSVLSTDGPSLAMPEPRAHVLSMEEAKVRRQVAAVRSLGCASLSLAYVASGRLEGYWEDGLKWWDMVAGVCLLREAGGVVTDREGKKCTSESTSVLCSNQSLYPALRSLIHTSDV